MYVPLKISLLDYFKHLNFLIYITSVGRRFRKTSAIPTYHEDSRKKVNLKHTPKNSIKTMQNSTLTLVIDKTLAWFINNNICIFLKFTCDFGEKSKA